MSVDEVPMRGWGLPEAGELDRIVIVSPHLDDAVLGCGNFMAAHPGAFVVTVFAGNPPEYPTDPMRKWDVQSGLSPGDDVMEIRRHEDDAALDLLEATPVHLEFIEHSYLPGRSAGRARCAGRRAGPGARNVAPDAGDDSVRSRESRSRRDAPRCMLARERLGAEVSWWCYEDHGYKHIPGMLAWRVASLFRRKLWPTPVCPPTDPSETKKQAAIACYPTQLLALEDDWAIRAKLAAPAPEQFWRLNPPPAGWERLSED